MTLFGLALLPDDAMQSLLVDWRAGLDHVLVEPGLGLEENLPHSSVLQCPFHAERLTAEKLESVASEARSLHWPVMEISDVYFQPSDWVFLRFGPAEALFALQDAALKILERDIDTSAIERKPRYNGYTESEVRNYERWGYRYIADDYRPHITLGRVAPGESAVPALVNEEFEKRILGHRFAFKAIAFYEAGKGGALARIVAQLPLPDAS